MGIAELATQQSTSLRLLLWCLVVRGGAWVLSEALPRLDLARRLARARWLDALLVFEALEYSACRFIDHMAAKGRPWDGVAVAVKVMAAVAGAIAYQVRKPER